MGFLAPRTKKKDQLVVLYDGECVLCNSTVDFLLKRDTENLFLFAQLQGDTGQGILERHEENSESLESIVYVRNYKTNREALYVKSTAVLRALDDLGGAWRILSWLRFLPRASRDFVYDLIANNRYNWFGKYDQCRIPGSSDRDRFLE